MFIYSLHIWRNFLKLTGDCGNTLLGILVKLLILLLANLVILVVTLLVKVPSMGVFVTPDLSLGVCCVVCDDRSLITDAKQFSTFCWSESLSVKSFSSAQHLFPTSLFLMSHSYLFPAIYFYWRMCLYVFFLFTIYLLL